VISQVRIAFPQLLYSLLYLLNLLQRICQLKLSI